VDDLRVGIDANNRFVLLRTLAAKESLERPFAKTDFAGEAYANDLLPTLYTREFREDRLFLVEVGCGVLGIELGIVREILRVLVELRGLPRRRRRDESESDRDREKCGLHGRWFLLACIQSSGCTRG
jgi:hypothetical protein